MRYSRVPGVDTLVSRVALGTSGIRSEQGYPLLDGFFAAGGNCLDTAAVYGGGASERAVGAWLRKARPDNVVLLAKGAHPPNCTPGAVAVELAETLHRFGVPTVDLYLLHRDNPDVPVGEFVDALAVEVRKGTTRAYGVSNWTRERVTQAVDYAEAHDLPPMTALSNHFSLAMPVEALYPGCEAVDGVYRDVLEKLDVALFPWSSQARGYFADVDPRDLDPNVWRCWDSLANATRRDRARSLAVTLGVAPINVALGYVLAQPFPTFPIVGPRSVGELVIALGGLSVELNPEQLQWLEHAEAGGTDE